jgi:hypothetical protein
MFGLPDHINSHSTTAIQIESEQDKRLKQIEEKMRSIQGVDRLGDLDFSDLALFQEIPMPDKFKVPDFEKFDGTGHPVVHLKIYMAKMSPYQQYTKLMVQTF